jgi:uncharacterized protein
MIEIDGQRTLERPPAEAWRLLMDPDLLRTAIPGCEEFKEIGPGRYRIALEVGLRLVRGRFEGEAAIEEVTELERYRLVIRARGKLGWIEGTTDVELAPAGGGGQCRVGYSTRLKVGGMLALSAPVLQATARSFVEEFFAKLERAA